jgi:vesicle coat complex subunit
VTDILRRYPEHAATVVPELHKCLKGLDDPEAKAAMVWMLGEYGEVIEDRYPHEIEHRCPVGIVAADAVCAVRTSSMDWSTPSRTSTLRSALCLCSYL